MDCLSIDLVQRLSWWLSFEDLCRLSRVQRAFRSLPSEPCTLKFLDLDSGSTRTRISVQIQESTEAATKVNSSPTVPPNRRTPLQPTVVSAAAALTKLLERLPQTTRRKVLREVEGIALDCRGERRNQVMQWLLETAEGTETGTAEKNELSSTEAGKAPGRRIGTFPTGGLRLRSIRLTNLPSLSGLSLALVERSVSSLRHLTVKTSSGVAPPLSSTTPVVSLPEGLTLDSFVLVLSGLMERVDLRLKGQFRCKRLAAFCDSGGILKLLCHLLRKNGEEGEESAHMTKGGGKGIVDAEKWENIQQPGCDVCQLLLVSVDTRPILSE
eukprot:Cvel_7343.t1-p1 / transcript=Cvel_7343.t1 / gene=Cvel_7343 / organism=Chromera_velia_CCMP2878 / gene_product=hypothetical protein / transcript_product=hypothetical protein / location=Cvel_scaffold381:676-1933(-) / protein_length=325 / sequence_SO=supercontig / SO=protein_coding / is_pseudo=false